MMAKILGCTVQEIEYNTKDIGVEIVLLWGDYIKLGFERFKIDRQRLQTGYCECDRYKSV